MKFKIKYADKIVGFFSILALAVLIVLIFSIGSKQNWFEKKYHFHTQFDTASNISAEMALQYKGFTIGKVSKVELKNDQVWADWYILEKYISYAKFGSLVELVVSPIGLGTQFVFHPGNTNMQLKEGSEVYRTDTAQGKQYVKDGLVLYEHQKDSISALLQQVSTIMDNVNTLIEQVNTILSGQSQVPTAQILQNVATVTGQVQTLLGGINRELYPQIDRIMADINAITTEIQSIAGTANTAMGTANTLIGTANTLVGNTTPQVNTVLSDVNTLLLQIQDVMEGLKNNPLIKNGITDKSSTGTALPASRNEDW